MEKLFHKLLMDGRNRGDTDLLLKAEGALAARCQGVMVRHEETIPRELLTWLKEATQVAEGDASYEYQGRYRLNLFQSDGKDCACIRLIKQEIPRPQDLGINGSLSQRIRREKGLSLVVGKTGSGKSTTLASLLEEILQEEAWHIITLEDPVEYRLRAYRGVVTQRELGKDFPSFQAGIRSALRQSPDLIMIGEIRDTASMKAALEAAETGSGVVATLHCLGAANTMSRILQMFSPLERDFIRFQVSQSLNFIQSQILKRDGHGLKLDYELLVATAAVRNTIKEGDVGQLTNLIVLGKRQGMKAFETMVKVR